MTVLNFILGIMFILIPLLSPVAIGIPTYRNKNVCVKIIGHDKVIRYYSAHLNMISTINVDGIVIVDECIMTNSDSEYDKKLLLQKYMLRPGRYAVIFNDKLIVRKTVIKKSVITMNMKVIPTVWGTSDYDINSFV